MNFTPPTPIDRPALHKRVARAATWAIIAVALFTAIVGCGDSDDPATATATASATTSSTTSLAANVPTTTTHTGAEDDGEPTTSATGVDGAPTATASSIPTSDTARSATTLSKDEVSASDPDSIPSEVTDSSAGSTDPSSSQSSTAPSANCDDSSFGDDVIDVRNDPDPGTVEGLLLSSVRTGSTDCYERIVWDFGNAEPPWFYIVEPVESDDGDFVMGQADPPEAPVAHVEGDAFVQVIIQATSVDFDRPGGPEFVIDERPQLKGVTSIMDLVRIDDFEGQMNWIVGLDEQRPYRVFTLTDPGRLVLDIATGD